MPKPIFNSLGSNYTFHFAWLSLRQIFKSNPESLKKLESALEKKYTGKAVLVYKGRDAIELALRAYGVSTNDAVLTQAFTCYAIEEAIVRAGAEPVFVDLEKGAVNPSLKNFQIALEKNSNAKAVLVQHTLGYAASICEIRQWCDVHHLVLIEDLAQSVGAKDKDGAEVGKYGHCVICSFGRDKILDGVTGGAVIFKSPSNITGLQIDIQPPRSAVIKDLMYPFLTWLIRTTHQILFGKILFQVARGLGILTSPIESPTTKITALPAAHAPLILKQLSDLENQLHHRMIIAEIYEKELGQNEKIHRLSDARISSASNLRYSFLVDDPTKLANALTKKSIYITDRWYRQPVDFGSLSKETKYIPSGCPNAEYVAQKIINLPTHHGISSHDARRLATAVKEML